MQAIQSMQDSTMYVVALTAKWAILRVWKDSELKFQMYSENTKIFLKR